MSLFLDIAVQEAIERIQKAYKMTDGKIYLSFSGGKDSTIVAELIKMANLPTDIPFVFADTGIEFNATTNFVKSYDYNNMVVVKPRKPFAKVLKDYGKPAISKLKAEHLKTYQKNQNNPMKFARCRHLITGEAEKGGVKLGVRTQVALSEKHFHFLHPDHEYKIANQCCNYMKKYPFEDFAKENNMNGYITGVRVAEGGIRALKYTKCTNIKKVAGKDMVQSMPIYDWTDSLCDEFVEKYNVQLSDVYTVYGMKRSGCVGCPYSPNIAKELEVAFEYEPLRYKACMTWLKDVYLDQDVELPFDKEYELERIAENEKNDIRRTEMIVKYLPTMNRDIRKKLFDKYEDKGVAVDE